MDDVKLRDVCRCCLMKAEKMRSIYPKSEFSAYLISQLSSVGHFEIDLNEFLPGFVCESCEEKLKISYEFQLLLRKSNETIKVCVADTKSTLIPKSEHQPKKKNFCQQCQKRVKSLSNHNTNFHSNLKPFSFQCRYCDRRTTTKFTMLMHERIHTGEKPHVCTTCDKGFAQSSALRIHMRQHTGRPVGCTLCPKRFCRDSELRVHMRAHTGEKPYICEVCGQGFKQRSHLAGHLITHNNQTPYQCSTCEKTYKYKSSLRAHMNSHTENNRFKCEFCPYISGRHSYLAKHIIKQHENENITNK